jgi:hypothetical protein
VACAAADGANHVAVVVEHSDGRWLSKCVSFSAASITGEQALDASGIDHQYYDYGGSLGKAVCQVDGEPTTPASGWTRSNCLGYPYWSSWNSRGGGGWTGATRGVSNTYYSDGDAEGLRYGDGSGAPPPALGVCPRAASPVAQPASPPSRSPVPGSAGRAPAVAPAVAPTATPSMTSSPTPSPITSPSAEPTPKPRFGAKASSGAGPLKPSIGWLAAAAAAVVLGGMLAVQLLAGRRGA